MNDPPQVDCLLARKLPWKCIRLGFDARQTQLCLRWPAVQHGCSPRQPLPSALPHCLVQSFVWSLSQLHCSLLPCTPRCSTLEFARTCTQDFGRDGQQPYRSQLGAVQKSHVYLTKAETHLCKAANAPVISQAAQLADWVHKAGHLVLSVQTLKALKVLKDNCLLGPCCILVEDN